VHAGSGEMEGGMLYHHLQVNILDAGDFLRRCFSCGAELVEVDCIMVWFLEFVDVLDGGRGFELVLAGVGRRSCW
jgi:hypothetical protein